MCVKKSGNFYITGLENVLGLKISWQNYLRVFLSVSHGQMKKFLKQKLAVGVFKDGFRTQVFSLFEEYGSQVCINNDKSFVFNHLSQLMLSYLLVQARQSKGNQYLCQADQSLAEQDTPFLLSIACTVQVSHSLENSPVLKKGYCQAFETAFQNRL